MTAPKQYGLIIPKKKNVLQSAATARPSIFGDDADEEQPTSTSSGSKKPSAFSSRIKKQTQIEIEKALAEDPTVYEYDAVYDDIEKKRAEANPKIKSKDRKPRYIAGLLKAAEERQREWERRQERLVHKEREQEGDEFKDKDAFVTDSYRKKMIELQKLEEEEKKREEYEARMDVTKQDGLGGFYKFQYQMRTGDVRIKEEGDNEPAAAVSSVEIKEEQSADAASPRPQQSSGSNSRSQSPTTSRRARSRSRSSSRSRSHAKRRSRSRSPSKTVSKSRRSRSKSPSSKRPSRPVVVPKPSEIRKAAEEETETERLKALLAKRTDNETANDARSRYLARKAAMAAEVKVYIEKEEE